ncbi:hypothetical protein FA10DRAFT_290913 [Acaromyces ingoldii]|uniref:Uncharacterized protein n=1 Tax=Acaromyces ingoldii TaxID=215250 RepID=A0A316YVY5_9BASI|nr:hypothetical protein FA10DRAFT_290913 [Acaromyces ingoldii]PWN93720.1 hypothetical protein FA10DRAFT_290913 [Acaromyces ingoldii]
MISNDNDSRTSIRSNNKGFQARIVLPGYGGLEETFARSPLTHARPQQQQQQTTTTMSMATPAIDLASPRTSASHGYPLDFTRYGPNVVNDVLAIFRSGAVYAPSAMTIRSLSRQAAPASASPAVGGGVGTPGPISLEKDSGVRLFLSFRYVGKKHASADRAAELDDIALASFANTFVAAIAGDDDGHDEEDEDDERHHQQHQASDEDNAYTSHAEAMVASGQDEDSGNADQRGTAEGQDDSEGKGDASARKHAHLLSLNLGSLLAKRFSRQSRSESDSADLMMIASQPVVAEALADEDGQQPREDKAKSSKRSSRLFRSSSGAGATNNTDVSKFRQPVAAELFVDGELVPLMRTSAATRKSFATVFLLGGGGRIDLSEVLRKKRAKVHGEGVEGSTETVHAHEPGDHSEEILHTLTLHLWDATRKEVVKGRKQKSSKKDKAAPAQQALQGEVMDLRQTVIPDVIFHFEVLSSGSEEEAAQHETAAMGLGKGWPSTESKSKGKGRAAANNSVPEDGGRRWSPSNTSRRPSMLQAVTEEGSQNGGSMFFSTGHKTAFDRKLGSDQEQVEDKSEDKKEEGAEESSKPTDRESEGRATLTGGDADEFVSADASEKEKELKKGMAKKDTEVDERTSASAGVQDEAKATAQKAGGRVKEYFDQDTRVLLSMQTAVEHSDGIPADTEAETEAAVTRTSDEVAPADKEQEDKAKRGGGFGLLGFLTIPVSKSAKTHLRRRSAISKKKKDSESRSSEESGQDQQEGEQEREEESEDDQQPQQPAATEAAATSRKSPESSRSWKKSRDSRNDGGERQGDRVKQVPEALSSVRAAAAAASPRVATRRASMACDRQEVQNLTSNAEPTARSFEMPRPPARRDNLSGLQTLAGSIPLPAVLRPAAKTTSQGNKGDQILDDEAPRRWSALRNGLHRHARHRKSNTVSQMTAPHAPSRPPTAPTLLANDEVWDAMLKIRELRIQHDVIEAERKELESELRDLHLRGIEGERQGWEKRVADSKGQLERLKNQLAKAQRATPHTGAALTFA